MGDHCPSNLPVQVGDHSIRPTARSEAPGRWDPYHHLPDLLWSQRQHLAHAYSQEMPSIISDATNLRTVWPRYVNELTAGSPIHLQSQNPEMPFLTFAPGNFDGSVGDQAGASLDCYTQAGYNQHITTQEGQIQLTRRQPLQWGFDSPSNPGGNAQIWSPRNANTFSSDMYPGQVPRQQWEEPKEARQDTDPGCSWNSQDRRKAPRGMHHCADCSKRYARAQDLKRHTRDKHEWRRKCPFCRSRWSRPERIRAHLMKKHESRLTKDEQREIRFLRGREDTIHFLEKYGNTVLPGNYTPN